MASKTVTSENPNNLKDKFIVVFNAMCIIFLVLWSVVICSVVHFLWEKVSVLIPWLCLFISKKLKGNLIDNSPKKHAGKVVSQVLILYHKVFILDMN